MCTDAYGPSTYFSFGPGWIDPAFPANGMFTQFDISSWYRSNALVVMDSDPVLSARLGLDVYHPRQPLRAGDVLTFWDEDECAPPCSYCKSPCIGYEATIADPDLTAPTQPALTLHTQLVRDPDGAGALTCGDGDALEIVVSVFDDTTPIDQLGLVAYVATTPDEVAQLTAPSTVLPFDYHATGTTATASISLGESVGHVRSGDAPFLSPDPFCFALAAFDRAGNLGERSLTACVDTNDVNDPTVQWVDSEGCGCQSHGGGGLVTALLVGFVALALRGSGRGRRPDTR